MFGQRVDASDWSLPIKKADLILQRTMFIGLWIIRGLLLRNILIVHSLILGSPVILHATTLPSDVPGINFYRPFATGEVFTYNHSDLKSHLNPHCFVF